MTIYSHVSHRTACNALLPLAHADALFQRGAFLEHQIPAAVWISGPHTGFSRLVEVAAHQGDFDDLLSDSYK